MTQVGNYSVRLCTVQHLLKYFANSSAFLGPAANITLVLEQGHHQLEFELMVSNVNALLIISDNSTFDTPSVSIKLARFSNISWLRISNINFTHSRERSD